MRTPDDVYWTTSLPGDHEALQTLDAYCKEWGRLSRAEATRRLLIEWSKIQRGQPIATWVPTQLRESVMPERALRASGTTAPAVITNQVARAASRVLDE